MNNDALIIYNKYKRYLYYTYSWKWQVPRGLENENGEPLNKGNIYIAKTSPPEISNAYSAQFKRDFTLFLQSRSREMVCGGRMVLTFRGCHNSDEPDIWDVLGTAVQDMVTKVINNFYARIITKI